MPQIHVIDLTEHLQEFQDFRKRFLADPDFAAEQIVNRIISIYDDLLHSWVRLDETLRLQEPLPEAFEHASIDMEQLRAAHKLLLETAGFMNEVYRPVEPELQEAQRECREEIAARRMTLENER